MTVSRNLRVLALAVQLFGADSTDAKELLESEDFGLNPNCSDRTLAKCVALTLSAR